MFRAAALPGGITRVRLGRLAGPLVGGLVLSVLAGACADRGASGPSAVPLLRFASSTGRLTIEALSDTLLHFEFAPPGDATAAGDPGGPDGRAIYSTPMIAQSEFDGPARFAGTSNGFVTAALRASVDPSSLCLTVVSLGNTSGGALTTVCPQGFSGQSKALTLSREATDAAYGLGEHFLAPNQPDGDLVGHQIVPGDPNGNALTAFNGGITGNAQFPVLYALGRSGEGYALFVDQLDAQTWDLTGDPLRVSMDSGEIRGYLLAGRDLAGLRAGYMDLVGHPLVPPRKMFGLWVSEFGFDDWAEIDDKLRTLRANQFPIDGFVLDLNWFGGVFNRPSHIGALTFDPDKFPDAPDHVAAYRDQDGVGLMLIEESYVDGSRPEYADLAQRGDMPLAGDGSGPVAFIAWWGNGSMLDWTNDAAGDYWHDLKREALIEMGIIGHWTDLGEPETYDQDARYHGFPALGLHGEHDVHNLYNFKWAESIQRGYARHHTTARPFILSRSGTAGIQRFGAAMWSGDIGSNLTSLATHLDVQAQMSFSGIDFFGADIGGYHREALDGDLNQMYTTWFANGSLLDVPVRPHTENLCNCKETAPDRIGDLPSNLDNLRLRYSLIPYLYSLAYRAHLYGEPVVPPLVLYAPADENVHQLADEKLLGRDLLVATVSAYAETARDVYLPAGTWADYRTQEWSSSAGEWARAVPTSIDGRFRLPLFARAGAIIPEMYVDEQTMNASGRRLDGTTRDDLVLRVYADAQPSSFTLYEDDGSSVAYLSGATRTTLLEQQQEAGRIRVTIGAASGSYAGAPSSRDNLVELVARNAQAAAVSLNGVALAEQPSADAFAAQPSGWFAGPDGILRVKSGQRPVDERKQIEIQLVAPGAAP